MDYEELTGKEAKYVYSNGVVNDVVVIACVQDIGISIVNKYNHDDYMVCINLEKSPAWSELSKSDKLDSRASFEYVTACLKNDKTIYASSIGRIEAEFGKKDNHFSIGPNSGSCVFSL